MDELWNDLRLRGWKRKVNKYFLIRFCTLSKIHFQIILSYMRLSFWISSFLQNDQILNTAPCNPKTALCVLSLVSPYTESAIRFIPRTHTKASREPKRHIDYGELHKDTRRAQKRYLERYFRLNAYDAVCN